MSLATIITMGSISVGGVIIEKVLGKMGKIEEAGMVSTVTTCMLATTVVGTVITVFNAVRKLGN